SGRKRGRSATGIASPPRRTSCQKCYAADLSGRPRSAHRSLAVSGGFPAPVEPASPREKHVVQAREQPPPLGRAPARRRPQAHVAEVLLLGDLRMFLGAARQVLCSSHSALPGIPRLPPALLRAGGGVHLSRK